MTKGLCTPDHHTLDSISVEAKWWTNIFPELNTRLFLAHIVKKNRVCILPVISGIVCE